MDTTTRRTLVTKAEYAALKRRAPSAISNWIASGRITPAALIGGGKRAKVWVERADADLAARLDPSQQDTQSRPISATAASGNEAEDVAAIRRARLEQLERANRKAAEEEAARAGRYVLTADVAQQMGRIASDLVAAVEAWLIDLANALAVKWSLPAREVQIVLRAEFKQFRARAASIMHARGEDMPRLLADDIPEEASR